MQKYIRFVDYLQDNYLEEVKKILKYFIKTNYISNKIQLIQYDDYNINEITFCNVYFTKSEIDKVKFEIHIKVNFDLIKNTNPIVSHKMENFLVLSMKGSFKLKFKVEQNIRIEDVVKNHFDRLVPIMHVKDLDMLATKFLKEFYPNALQVPTKLNVNKMLRDKGIEYFYAPLGEDILGKIYFADDIASVYDDIKTYKIIEKKVKSGTILINLDKYIDFPIGVYRNTIIHEIVHWYFHRNYFEIQRYLNYGITNIECYENSEVYTNEDIYWMEWQAKSLAPRILMPKKMFLQKFNEINQKIDEISKSKKISLHNKWQIVVSYLAEFFGVSRKSAKIRLRELGKIEVDGVENFIDGSYIKPFTFKTDTLNKNQTFVLGNKDLAQLLTKNHLLRNLLNEEKILYINKLLVINNSKYVDYKKRKLTKYALNNIHECCLIINHSYDKLSIKKKKIQPFLLTSSINNNNTLVELDDKQITKVMKLSIDGASHFASHINKLPTKFCDLLDYHIKKNNFTYEKLSYISDISERTIRRYKAGETVPSRINIIKLGLAMKLSSPYIFHMLRVANLEITNYDQDSCLLIAIINGCQRQGLEIVYKELKKCGKENILNFSNTYKKNHYLE